MSVTMTAKVWQLQLDPTTKMVLLRLADYVNRDRITAWPSVETLARECCVNKRTVLRCLRGLRALHLIEPVERAHGYKSVVYALYPERGDKLSPQEVAQDHPKRWHRITPGVTSDAQRGDPVPPKPEGTVRGTGKVNRPGGRPPLEPPLAPLSPADRARNGSKRKTDIDALRAETESQPVNEACLVLLAGKSNVDCRRRSYRSASWCIPCGGTYVLRLREAVV